MLWPNPAAERCQVRIRTPQPTVVQIEVFGANLRSTGISMRLDVAEEAIAPLDLGRLPAGTYHIVVSDGQDRVVLALVYTK
jgi:hypothetical protein